MQCADFVHEVLVYFLEKYRWDDEQAMRRGAVVRFAVLASQATRNRVLRREMVAQRSCDAIAADQASKHRRGSSKFAARSQLGAEIADRELQTLIVRRATTNVAGKYQVALTLIMQGLDLKAAAKQLGVRRQALQQQLRQLRVDLQDFADSVSENPCKTPGAKQKFAQQIEASARKTGQISTSLLQAKISEVNKYLRQMGEPEVEEHPLLDKHRASLENSVPKGHKRGLASP